MSEDVDGGIQDNSIGRSYSNNLPIEAAGHGAVDAVAISASFEVLGIDLHFRLVSSLY
jgi:hypothetical protein